MTARTSARARARIVATLAALLPLGACGEGGGRRPAPPPAPADARYVGGAACAECHAAEHARWRGSHHDLAMQPATGETVLGDFEGAEHEQFGVRSSFRREGPAFVVRTEGPDGALADFEVAWVFGVTPLQQYLVAFPDGRLQCLPLAWDTRPAEAGGQRWFHLYPDEHIPAGDELHWTGPNQNWNFMCAECHSTDLRKEYRVEGDRYETSWAELDVSCEACHGPASAHVEWARALAPDDAGPHGSGTAVGLTFDLGDTDDPSWVFDPDTAIARRDPPRASHVQVELCARCHARRSVISEDYVHGRPLLDTHRPALLSEGLYHADGQILEEVYVYGSFVQSRMYAAGVTCSDCHEPHSLEPVGGSDEVCSRCHLPERFAAAEHHRHDPGTPGASCVECHMPATTYMVVDPRHDHSMRVPRPDLAPRIGAPDACTACHAEDPRAEIAAAFREWYPERAATPHYGEALHGGRQARPGADAALAALARDAESPPIVRATALELLRDHGAADEALVADCLGDAEPLVRLGALELSAALPAERQLRLVAPLLSDPVRALRIEAGRLLAGAPDSALSEEALAARAAALEEYAQAQLANADRAGSHLNLGTLHLEQGDPAATERDYLRAIAMDPAFGPAYVNLSDLYRLTGRDAEGEALLREGIARAPRDAGVQHALGLLLVRLKRYDEAVEALRRASELDPASPDYLYVLAVAELETGGRERALDTLRTARGRFPYDAPTLALLAQELQRRGEFEEALDAAYALRRARPDDPAVAGLVAELERALR